MKTSHENILRAASSFVSQFVEAIATLLADGDADVWDFGPPLLPLTSAGLKVKTEVLVDSGERKVVLVADSFTQVHEQSTLSNQLA